jgi:hypothetical protein
MFGFSVGLHHSRVSFSIRRSGFFFVFQEENICDLAMLVDRVKEAYPDPKTRPGFLYIVDCLDWEKYLQPAMLPIFGHSKPLGFRIQRDSQSGKICLDYKEDSSCDWAGMNPSDHQQQLRIKETE